MEHLLTIFLWMKRGDSNTWSLYLSTECDIGSFLCTQAASSIHLALLTRVKETCTTWKKKRQVSINQTRTRGEHYLHTREKDA